MKTGVLQLGIPLILLMMMGTGCATLSEHQCAKEDWHTIGYNDGVNGYQHTRMDTHQKACAEYGIVIDRTEYLAGYDKGLQQYCIPLNGYQVGLAGETYLGICTGPLAEEFIKHYQGGKREYDIRQRLDEIEKKVDEINKKLNETRLSTNERRNFKHQRNELEKEKMILLIESSSKNVLDAGQ